MTIVADLGENVLVIIEELFTAMIAAEPGSLRSVPDDVVLVDPCHAWVDISGDVAARTVISTNRGTVAEIARALFMMTAAEQVSPEDLVDAFGEVANVIGGNVKSLIAEAGTLSLPTVADRAPGAGVELLHHVALDWDGHRLAVDIWKLGEEGGTA